MLNENLIKYWANLLESEDGMESSESGESVVIPDIDYDKNEKIIRNEPIKKFLDKMKEWWNNNFKVNAYDLYVPDE